MNDKIFMACKKGDLAALKELVQENPQLVNQRDATEQKYPFTVAVLSNHLEIVVYLLNKHIEDPQGFPISLDEVLWENHLDSEYDDNEDSRNQILEYIYENFDRCKFTDGTTRTHIAVVLAKEGFCRENINTFFTPDEYGITPIYYLLHNQLESIVNLVQPEKISHEKVIVHSALKSQDDESYRRLLFAYTRLSETLDCVDKTGYSQLATMKAAIDCVGKIKSLNKGDSEDLKNFRNNFASNAKRYADYLIKEKKDYENAVIILKDAITTLKKDIVKPESANISQLYLTIAQIYSLPILLNDKNDPSLYYNLVLEMMCNSKWINNVSIVELFANWQRIFFINSSEWNFLELGRIAFSLYQQNNNFTNLLQQTFHVLDFTFMPHEQKSRWRSMIVNLIELLLIFEKTNNSLQTNGTLFISGKENRAFIIGKLEELRKSIISPLAMIIEHHPSTTSALVHTVTKLKENTERELIELKKENQLLREKIAQLNHQVPTITTNSMSFAEKTLPATSANSKTSAELGDQNTRPLKEKRKMSDIPKDSPILSSSHIPTVSVEVSEITHKESKQLKR